MFGITYKININRDILSSESALYKDKASLFIDNVADFLLLWKKIYTASDQQNQY